MSAFCAERALPSGVFGPRDFAPFPRLPSTRALLMETAARGAAPALTWRDSWLAGGGWRAVAKDPGLSAGQRVRPIIGNGPEVLPKIRKLSRALETSGLGPLSRPSTARTAMTACSQELTWMLLLAYSQLV